MCPLSVVKAISGLEVPNFGGFVVRSSSEPFTIGRKSHARDGVSVALERCQSFSGLEVPNFGGVVVQIQ
jgi:hypothetical protein